MKCIFALAALALLGGCSDPHAPARHAYWESQKGLACLERGLTYRRVEWSVAGAPGKGSVTRRNDICVDSAGRLYEFWWPHGEPPPYAPPARPRPDRVRGQDICIGCKTALPVQ